MWQCCCMLQTFLLPNSDVLKYIHYISAGICILLLKWLSVGKCESNSWPKVRGSTLPAVKLNICFQKNKNLSTPKQHLPCHYHHTIQISKTSIMHSTTIKASSKTDNFIWDRRKKMYLLSFTKMWRYLNVLKKTFASIFAENLRSSSKNVKQNDALNRFEHLPHLISLLLTH